MALSITTFSITTLSIRSFDVTLSISERHTQYFNRNQSEESDTPICIPPAAAFFQSHPFPYPTFANCITISCHNFYHDWKKLTVSVNDNQHSSSIVLSVIMLSVAFILLLCWVSDFIYYYAECRILFTIMVNVVMLSVIMLSVVAPENKLPRVSKAVVNKLYN